MRIEVIECKDLPDGSCECVFKMDAEAQKHLIQKGFIAIVEEGLYENQEQQDKV